jgi:dephospho-CoA kinase
MRVVATTGMPGSGKSLAIEVAEEIGYEVVSMGDIVREETRKRGLPAEPESFGKVASEVREEHGPGAWAQPTAERVRSLDADGVLVDGLRNIEELEILREELEDDVLVVAMLASPATRYARMKERGRAEDGETEEELHERDLRELGYGLGDVVAMADVYVDNEGDPAQAKATLRGVLGAEA